MRCIIPASGYYEWRAAEDGKQPYFISAADGAVLSIAGLWDEWRDPETWGVSFELHVHCDRCKRLHATRTQSYAGLAQALRF
jgi:putative SOS response-associated peptidase YedK